MQPRQVLALLALRANDSVPMTELKRELWGARPPLSAVTVIQNYITTLRKGIACQVGSRETAQHMLTTGRSGYCLRMDPGGLDAEQFERHAREGSRALTRKAAAEAAKALQGGLSMWRGPVLSDIEPGPALAVEVVRLETMRLLVVEQHLDASLRLGRHYEQVGEIASLIERNPLAERLHQLYMVALHRTGRRAEALQVYEFLRRNLDEQLGLQPSPSMQRARHAVVHAAEVGAEDAPPIQPDLLENGPLVIPAPRTGVEQTPAQSLIPARTRT